MKKYLVLVCIGVLLCGTAFADERVSLSGYAKTEIALRVEGMNNDLNKLKNIIHVH